VLAWPGLVQVVCRWGNFGISAEASPSPRRLKGDERLLVAGFKG